MAAPGSDRRAETALPFSRAAASWSSCDAADAQARYLEAPVNGILVASLYLPNGNPQPGPKFAYKLAWFEELLAPAPTLVALADVHRAGAARHHAAGGEGIGTQQNAVDIAQRERKRRRRVAQQFAEDREADLPQARTILNRTRARAHQS